MSPAAVALGILAWLALALSARTVRRNLRWFGARHAALVLSTAAFGLCALAILWAWISWLWQPLPSWIPLPLAAPWLVVMFFPRSVVGLTGGALPSAGVVQASWRIMQRWNAKARKGEISDRDRDWLRQAASDLERWRTPDTSELIDLWQANTEDLIRTDETEETARRRATREARISELATALQRQLADR